LLDETESVVDATLVARKEETTWVKRLGLSSFLLSDLWTERNTLTPYATYSSSTKVFQIRSRITLPDVGRERATVLAGMGRVIKVVVPTRVICKDSIILERSHIDRSTYMDIRLTKSVEKNLISPDFHLPNILALTRRSMGIIK
jgi:hypothetical protein